MPTYGYECSTCKEQFEVIQRITDSALAVHEGCGGSLRRLLYPVGIVFKGPGFHVNDYSKTGKKDASEKKDTSEKNGASEKSGKSAKSADATSDTKSEAKSETKTDAAKTETARTETAAAKAEPERRSRRR